MVAGLLFRKFMCPIAFYIRPKKQATNELKQKQ